MNQDKHIAHFDHTYAAWLLHWASLFESQGFTATAAALRAMAEERDA